MSSYTTDFGIVLQHARSVHAMQHRPDMHASPQPRSHATSGNFVVSAPIRAYVSNAAAFVLGTVAYAVRSIARNFLCCVAAGAH